MASKLDLFIEQGTSWSIAIPVSIDGSDIDNTWTVKSQVRTSATDSRVLHEWSVSVPNLAILDGHVVLAVSPTVSSAWRWTTAVYDLEISKSGMIYRVIEGKVKISPEVTR